MTAPTEAQITHAASRVAELLLWERRQLLDNLTATQARCTSLLEENRALKAKLANVALPGWFCPLCGCWNGEAKERLNVCRGHGCGIPRSAAMGGE